MKPIRKYEQEEWCDKISNLFRRKREDVELVYTQQLNEKVAGAIKPFLSKVGVAKKFAQAEKSANAYNDFKQSMNMELEKLKQQMIEDAESVQDHCNTFSQTEYGKNGEVSTISLDLDLWKCRDDGKLPTWKAIDRWANSYCRHIQKVQDSKEGNELVIALNGLDALETLAKEGFALGYSLDEAVDNMHTCFKTAGIVKAKTPKEIVLPKFIGHDK